MIEEFLSVAAMTFLACLVLAIPLWIASLLMRRRDVALQFAAAAVLLSVVFGLMGVSAESMVDSCEAEGGIGCADAYFGLVGVWMLAMLVFLVAALVGTFTIVWRPSRAKEDRIVVLWRGGGPVPASGEPVPGNGSASLESGVRRIADLVAGDRIMEADGIEVEVTGDPERWGGEIVVPVRTPHGRGVRRFPEDRPV